MKSNALINRVIGLLHVGLHVFHFKLQGMGLVMDVHNHMKS
jgi:hypothetical protein